MKRWLEGPGRGEYAFLGVTLVVALAFILARVVARMSRCAGCGYEHGLLEGWCDHCIANGKKLSAALAKSAEEIEARSIRLPLDATEPNRGIVTEYGFPSYPVRGGVYTDAQGRKLRVADIKVGAPDGREVIGTLERVIDSQRCTMPKRDDYSTTLRIWAHIWRDRRPPADPRTMKVGG